MIVMIDIRQSLGERAVDNLNNEFGRKRAVFLRCDVTNNSEFDGKYITISISSLLICILLNLLKQTRSVRVNYDKSQFNLHSYSILSHSHICLKSKILIVAATFKEERSS